MRSTSITLAALTLLLAAATAPALAASIHRETDATVVRASSPLATLASSPFDDAQGLLSDGVHYFWIVKDDAGLPLAISVHKNHVLGTVRISFDDSQSSQAPADAALSSVTVDPATIPADGVTIARVTINPRDTNGVRLGTGLAITVDGTALFPGLVVGAVIDNGDGSYTANVISTSAGSGQVWVDVEGIALDDEPTIVYETYSGPLDLRQDAIARLQALLANGGAFDQLIEGLDPGSDPGANKVQAAAGRADDALDVLLEDEYEDDESALGNFLKAAVNELLAATDNPGLVDTRGIRDLIVELLDIARDIALFHIVQATADCGPCTDGIGLLCVAQESLHQADEELALLDPDYELVINLYGTATGKAHAASNECE